MSRLILPGILIERALSDPVSRKHPRFNCPISLFTQVMASAADASCTVAVLGAPQPVRVWSRADRAAVEFLETAAEIAEIERAVAELLELERALVTEIEELKVEPDASEPYESGSPRMN